MILGVAFSEAAAMDTGVAVSVIFLREIVPGDEECFNHLFSEQRIPLDDVISAFPKRLDATLAESEEGDDSGSNIGGVCECVEPGEDGVIARVLTMSCIRSSFHWRCKDDRARRR